MMVVEEKYWQDLLRRVDVDFPIFSLSLKFACAGTLLSDNPFCKWPL